MNAQNVMEEWETSPFDGGFDGLRDLRSRRFSGAVEAGGSWLFLRDGDPLAVVDDLEVDPRPGDVDAFEGAGGQAHEAAQPATATLAAMLALDGDVRGQYFTEDTPLSTVHETLSDGGFTGYVELSENVLSGDYYVVYEDGDEDYLGILGSSNRLITDDEAQSKAEGEVGIYSVVAVRFPDVEIPEAESTTADAAGTVAAGAAGAGETADSTALDDPGDPVTDAGADPGLAAGAGAEADTELDVDADPEGSVDADEPADPEPALEEEIPDPEADPDAETAPGSEPESEPEPEREPESEPEQEAASDAQGGIVTDSAGQSSGSSEAIQDATPGAESSNEASTQPAGELAGHPDADSDSEPGSNSDPDPVGLGDSASGATGAGSAGPGANGSADPDLDGVTTRAVPSLDPERTGRAESSRPSGDVQAPDTRAATGAKEEPEPQAEPSPEPARQEASGGGADPEPADDDRIEAVREEYEGRIDELEAELESLREERDRLQRRVSELESSSAEPASGGAGGTSLSPAEALAGTSLFVREGTRGEATLEDAHDGRTDRETLAKNLRIEYHTQFDDASATVDGEPFESWLRTTPRYDFVEWLIQDLLFEIQSTGSASGLRHLYDAIPLIDRVGFDDAVTVGEGEEGREITFDVVARNRMGEPLIAADIDEGREPTHAESIRPLVGDAEDVCTDHDTLAATFAVTSSYFEPDALDAAREATSGSLLGREKYRSYVKLARKNGFHLCLVESREESFHLAVPEL